MRWLWRTWSLFLKVAIGHVEYFAFIADLVRKKKENESGDLNVDILGVKPNPKPRREESGGVEGVKSWKVGLFCLLRAPLPSLVGISEPDLNLFIIFEGISPIGPCE